MLTLRCARCRQKLFKYLKVGKGRVLRCYKQRMSHDHTVHDGRVVRCQCGNAIGQDVGTWIKLERNAFTITGTKV
ncbi:hypothetical protein JXB22_00920 [candidate division WOR-3 bacterium]|nr:hypothetical protein [candidate division WOR-3 bacterium]